MKPELFGPYQLGSIQLKNRIVMAPMTRSRAVGNLANELMAEYYAQRASSGLIVTEGTSPSPNGLGYARIPGLFTDQQAEAWVGVTRRVHEKGGRVFVQLMHTGRIGHPLNLPQGARLLAPSPIAADGQMWTDSAGLLNHPVPEEMTEEDIQTAISEFAHSADLAVRSGFDGVELHAANGYLLNQFLNRSSNQRQDGWGGTVQNRIRFIVEVAKRVVQSVGASKVGVRLSPFSEFNSMEAIGHEEEYSELARQLSDLGIAYLHVISPSDRYAKEFGDLYTRMRRAFAGPLILAGNYNRERAEEDIRQGKADLVAFGRPFISNPDLVERIKFGAALAEPDGATFYTADARGYTDYPSSRD